MVLSHVGASSKVFLGGGGGSGVPGPMFPAMCPMVNRMMEDKNGPNMACGEGHILELWAVNGTLGSESESIINGLTDEVRQFTVPASKIQILLNRT